MKSADREGYWILEPGYTFSEESTAIAPKAVWTPGNPHWRYPGALAGSQDGQWRLAQGYLWVAPDDDDNLETFSIRATSQAWNSMLEIDVLTNAMRCSTPQDLQNDVGRARDLYASVTAEGAHPDVEKLRREIETTLAETYDTLNTCMAVDTGRAWIEIGVAAACLFAKEGWSECMEASKVRKGGEIAGGVASILCGADAQELRAKADRLERKRVELRGYFRQKHNLQLRQPGALVACQ
jgi:hypothetical protein